MIKAISEIPKHLHFFQSLTELLVESGWQTKLQQLALESRINRSYRGNATWM